MDRTVIGQRVKSDPSKKLKHGMSGYEAYQCAEAVITALTKMSGNKVSFSLLKFLKGNVSTTDGYTEDVWATIDAAFAALLDSSLIAVGNPQVTYKKYRKAAQLDRKLQQMKLVMSLCQVAEEQEVSLHQWGRGRSVH